LANPKVYGPSLEGDFPPEMRRQLWPLCCGASILSGFKSINKLTEKELVDNIKYACTTPIPDFQVFAHEKIRPDLTFLTLNNAQMLSPKIMKAIKEAGFFKIGTASPRGTAQGFFLRDRSLTWEST
jgi:hypothetical protein